MSERISTGNLDQIVKKNEEIRFVIEQNVLTVKTTCNTMQVNSSAQHALQLLRTYGLILLPIENEFWSGAIFVRDGKKYLSLILHSLGQINILQRGMNFII